MMCLEASNPRWPLATLYAYDDQNREVKDLTEVRIVSKIYVQ